MSVIAALAALSLLAVQPPSPGADEETPPPAAQAPAAPTTTPGPPTIDSILEQQQQAPEDARQAAVRAAFDAAQARRGQLDGRWRLSAADGHALYIFQFSDPGRSPDPRSSDPSTPVIEGAWSDPRRQGAASNSGFLASVRRDGDGLVVRFADRDPTRPQIVRLSLRPDGGWSGALEGEAAPQPVVMRRF
jgi:hypothetical protein